MSSLIITFLESTDFLYVIVSRAQENSCFILMLFVIAFTKPAPLIFALRTGHVHATLFLRNRGFTLGTRFCIRFKPIFSVILVNSLFPCLDILTISWLMGRLRAIKAKSSFTLVATHIYSKNGTFWNLTNHVATFTDTPLGQFTSFDI